MCFYRQTSLPRQGPDARNDFLLSLPHASAFRLRHVCDVAGRAGERHVALWAAWSLVAVAVEGHRLRYASVSPQVCRSDLSLSSPCLSSTTRFLSPFIATLPPHGCGQLYVDLGLLTSSARPNRAFHRPRLTRRTFPPPPLNSPKALDPCLKGRWLAFVGDSRARQLFQVRSPLTPSTNTHTLSLSHFLTLSASNDTTPHATTGPAQCSLAGRPPRRRNGEAC
jgi:hypothetical protein